MVIDKRNTKTGHVQRIRLINRTGQAEAPHPSRSNPRSAVGHNQDRLCLTAMMLLRACAPYAKRSVAHKSLAYRHNEQHTQTDSRSCERKKRHNEEHKQTESRFTAKER